MYKKIIYRSKRKKFSHLYGAKLWSEALVIGEELIRVFPNNINYLKRVAVCYNKLQMGKLATLTIKKAFEVKAGIKIDELIGYITDDLNLDQKVDSTYKHYVGHQNIGFIEHTTKGGLNAKLITKICERENNLKELLFYTQILEMYPEFNKITPKIFSVIELESQELFLVTMEKIEGRSPKIDDRTITKIISKSNKFGAIKYNDISQYAYLLESENEVKLLNKDEPAHTITLMKSFSRIDLMSTNMEIFKQSYRILKDKSFEVNDIIRRLEKIIMEEHLYLKINKYHHFGLQHGDFYEYNMIEDQETGDIKIIDWGGISIGPRWVENAILIARNKINFDMIEKYMKENLDYDSIETIFFLYTILITWAVNINRDVNEHIFIQNMEPLIRKIEELNKEIY